MNKIYNKLVRDNIPDIIKSSGGSCQTKILSDSEYLNMLDLKLDEELAEFRKDGNIEELADLSEVIRALCIAKGHTLEELENIRVEKEIMRGGFKKKIMLISVTEAVKP